MVKSIKISLVIFCVSCLSISCVKRKLFRDDLSLSYLNYLHSDRLCYNLSKRLPEIKVDSFGVDTSFMNMTRLKGDTMLYFNTLSSHFHHDYTLYMDSYIDINTPFQALTQMSDDVFLYGRINFYQNITGYLLLFSKKDSFISKNSRSVNLLLFVVKSDTLRSIVELSRYDVAGEDTKKHIKTVRINRNNFVQLNYTDMIEGIPFERDSWIDEVKNYLQVKSKTLRYTIFFIDEFGFVKYDRGRIKEGILPKAVWDKSNWDPITIIPSM